MKMKEIDKSQVVMHTMKNTIVEKVEMIQSGNIDVKKKLPVLPVTISNQPPLLAMLAMINNNTPTISKNNTMKHYVVPIHRLTSGT